MGDLGLPELVVILVIGLLVFGPSRLPDMGRSLGRALREFREAIRGGVSSAGGEPRQLPREPEAPTGSTRPTTYLDQPATRDSQ